MAKKNKNRKSEEPTLHQEVESDISPVVEEWYRKIIRNMSWIVAICFLIVITLPNFDIEYLDEIIKFVFFLGVFNLFVFILLEFIGESLKKYLSRMVK